MSVLALVPARGGSRGIVGKNLTIVGDRPLVVWSVIAALAATAVDRVIVSTDDAEIAEVAAAAGAEVPFERPAELAGDLVTDLPVFQHAVGWLAEVEDYRPDLVVHLRPTSPARAPGLVDAAVDVLRRRPTATSVRSVSPAPLTPWKMYDIDTDGWLRPLLGTPADEAFNLPRQALPPAWVHDGVVDVIRTATILGGSMSGASILAFETPGEGVDIDNPADLVAAEAALARLAAGPPKPA